MTIDDCVFIDYLLYFFHSRKRSITKSLDQENLNEVNKLYKTQKLTMQREIKSKQEKKTNENKMNTEMKP